MHSVLCLRATVKAPKQRTEGIPYAYIPKRTAARLFRNGKGGAPPHVFQPQGRGISRSGWEHSGRKRIAFF